MKLYNLDTKITDKSYELLNSYVEEQRKLDLSRVSEIRVKCRNILEKNGIFEDRKNGIIYENMENELKKLAYNISYFNESNLEEITKNKIEDSIDDIANKIESLEQNGDFIYSNEMYTYNKAHNERNIKNLLFSYFEHYKANTVEVLLKRGYSQNTIDNIEEDILEYTTSKHSDILAEKFIQDGMKNIISLNESLTNLSYNILNEAEARYNCQLSGKLYDELREKRDIVREKAKNLAQLVYQINNLESKINQVSEI